MRCLGQENSTEWTGGKVATMHLPPFHSAIDNSFGGSGIDLQFFLLDVYF